MNTGSTFEPLAGTHISRACLELCHEATINCSPMTMKFNDIEVTANPGDIPSKVEERWTLAMDAAIEAYRNSPQYAAAQEKRNAEIRKGNILVAKLMNQLETLDFTDYNAILDWVYEISNPADDIGIGVPAAEIVATFSRNGYQPKANVGKDYDGTNRENVARYIIGQALDGLGFIGAPHPICRVFIDRYRNGEPGYGQ